MRDQYAGDISDYVKYAFLRAVGSASRLGVAWYYLPGHDGRADGQHREFLGQQAWRELDPAVFDALAALNTRSVQEIERAPFWAESTKFHRDPVARSAARTLWFNELVATLSGSKLIFVDPDNGLSQSSSPKHVSAHELAILHQKFGAVALIQFPRRQKHATLVEAQSQLFAELCGTRDVLTVRTTTSVPTSAGYAPRQRWFTLIGGTDEMHASARRFAQAFGRMPRAKA